MLVMNDVLDFDFDFDFVGDHDHEILLNKKQVKINIQVNSVLKKFQSVKPEMEPVLIPSLF